MSEIILLLETAAHDYPSRVQLTYCEKIHDYIVITNQTSYLSLFMLGGPAICSPPGLLEPIVFRIDNTKVEEGSRECRSAWRQYRLIWGLWLQAENTDSR